MEKIIEKDKCTGCTACVNICPLNAITMKIDKEGFKYPEINKKKCTNCKICEKMCPIINKKINISINECYAAYSNDKKNVETSSSGGIFNLIAKYIISENGIVIGAAFNDDNKLIHIPITCNEELYRIKGSKYIQSDLNNIFINIKENIDNRKVLFVGTPCQVGGLKAFLKKEYENLVCIDLICHGVPSPKLFEKYIKELENDYSNHVIGYEFRDKSTGWENYSNKIIFENKMKSCLAKKNEYMQLFLSDSTLRESCYNCNFKLGNKYSDITLGDFWGIKDVNIKMYNKLGVSAIIINSEKGKKLFNIIKKEITFDQCTLEDILKNNNSLKYSCNRPENRNYFYSDMYKNNILQLAKKYKKKQGIIKSIYILIKIAIKKVINRV
jgi:coenzyme F420-reducing hydrogenase beta subunit